MTDRDSAYTLDLEDTQTIREALLVGLASYGEIERVRDLQDQAELCGRPAVGPLRVLHPTGSAGTVSRFAEALRLIELHECSRRASDQGGSL